MDLIVSTMARRAGRVRPAPLRAVLYRRRSRRRHGGAGLGLAIAKSFANALGGDVRYEPAELSGACFHFELPREFAA